MLHTIQMHVSNAKVATLHLSHHGLSPRATTTIATVASELSVVGRSESQDDATSAVIQINNELARLKTKGQWRLSDKQVMDLMGRASEDRTGGGDARDSIRLFDAYRICTVRVPDTALFNAVMMASYESRQWDKVGQRRHDQPTLSSYTSDQ